MRAFRPFPRRHFPSAPAVSLYVFFTYGRSNIAVSLRKLALESVHVLCFYVFSFVQNARIRFQTNGSAHSVVSSECEFRKVRKWKGSNVEKADDGWEIIEDLKNISLPAQQLEEEGKEEDKEEGQKNTKLLLVAAAR